MQKNNLLPYLLLCVTFAQAQNLNNFNDVRQLGVLLNPAHIAQKNAKGELGVNMQMAGYSSYPDFYYRATSPIYELSTNYMHAFKLKKHSLGVGLLLSSRINGWSQFDNIGIVTAYTYHFDTKNRLACGVNLNMLKNKIGYHILEPTEIPFLYGNAPEESLHFYRQEIITSETFASINTGIAWQHDFNKNIYLKAGASANNINTPAKIYDYETTKNIAKSQTIATNIEYIGSVSTEALLFNKIGLAPMFFYKMQPQTDSTSINTGIYGGDIFLKNSKQQQFRIGYILTDIAFPDQHTRQFGTLSFRYQTAKIGISLSMRALEFRYATGYIGQTNFQYTF
jgi:Type IX secretion system membrane protein PorP/SprF